MHGRLVEQIGRRILGGELAPGAMLPREAELVQELGISRTAVREAIKVLAAKGLVESRQKLGMRVRPERAWNLLDPDVLAWQAASGPSPELIEHLVELRRMIEPAAARLAATRRSAEQLQALASALADMTAAVDDPLAYYRADLAFHRAVFAASGNPFVDRLGAIVSAVLEVSFRLQRRSLIPMAVGLAMHERVLDAVRARDADAAERAMDEIIEEARIELEQGDRSIGMKITKLETIRLHEFPNLLWVRVHTDEGLFGLGETFLAAAAVEAYLHEIVAPRMLGEDPLAIDLIAAKLYGYLGFRSIGRRDARQLGARHRALGPLGQGHQPADRTSCSAAAPRERIRTYNTCAGYQLHPRHAGCSRSRTGACGKQRRPLRGPRRLPAPRRRAGALAARAGHHRHEDLAVRPRGRGHAAATTSPAPTSTGRSSRSARSATRSATRWTSWSSSTRCGTCRPRCRSPARSSRSTPSGTRTRSRWTASATSATYAAASRAPICASETLASR